MTIPNRKIAVFTDFQATGPLVDSQFRGRVDRDHLQRFVLRYAAVPHHLGGVQVQRGGSAGAVRVDAHHDTSLPADPGVPWHGIVGLNLVAPKVGEHASTHASLRHFGGNLVRFQSVLHGANLESVFLTQPNHHQHLVAAIAVALNPNLTVQNLGESFQAKISFNLLALCDAFLVVLRGGKRPAVNRFNPHPGLRVPAAGIVAFLRHVLTERKFNHSRRIRNDQVSNRMAILVFDHHAFTADRVRAAVQQKRGSVSTG